MATIMFDLRQRIHMHPWHDARPMIRKALDAATELFQKNNINVSWVGGDRGIVIQAVPIVVGGQHYRGRSIHRNLIQLHSGIYQGRTMQVFNTPEQIAGVIIHECRHGWGERHVQSKSCNMHSNAGYRLCQMEVQKFLKRWGKLPPAKKPKPPTTERSKLINERKQLRRTRDKAKAEAAAATKRIIQINMRLDQIDRGKMPQKMVVEQGCGGFTFDDQTWFNNVVT